MMSRRRFLKRALAGGVAGTAALGVGWGAPPFMSAQQPEGTPVVGPVAGFDDPRRWSGRTLRVGAWGGEVQAALGAAVWRSFAEATGCDVVEVVADYDELADSARLDNPFADAVIVDELWAESALDRGEIQPHEIADPGAALVPGVGFSPSSLPAYAYALVSAYRVDPERDASPESWADWWAADRFPGERALARDPFGTFEFALLSAGIPPDALYPLDGARAIEQLKIISGTIVDRWWDSGLEPVRWLGNEQVDYVSAWHYRVVAGQRDGLAVDFTWNQGLLLTDRWVIPAAAAEPEIARDLLAYALAPEVQAALARQVPLGPVVSAALDLLDPRTMVGIPTSPAFVDRLIRPDVAWWAAHQGEMVQRFNLWLSGAPSE